MNNDLSLDLGFLIAYLIPGTLAVVLLAPSVPSPLCEFLGSDGWAGAGGDSTACDGVRSRRSLA
jgi:hypothetical protein